MSLTWILGILLGAALLFAVAPHLFSGGFLGLEPIYGLFEVAKLAREVPDQRTLVAGRILGVERDQLRET